MRRGLRAVVVTPHAEVLAAGDRVGLLGGGVNVPQLVPVEVPLFVPRRQPLVQALLQRPQISGKAHHAGLDAAVAEGQVVEPEAVADGGRSGRWDRAGQPVGVPCGHLSRHVGHRGAAGHRVDPLARVVDSPEETRVEAQVAAVEDLALAATAQAGVGLVALVPTHGHQRLLRDGQRGSQREVPDVETVFQRVVPPPQPEAVVVAGAFGREGRLAGCRAQVVLPAAWRHDRHTRGGGRVKEVERVLEVGPRRCQRRRPEKVVFVPGSVLAGGQEAGEGDTTPVGAAWAHQAREGPQLGLQHDLGVRGDRPGGAAKFKRSRRSCAS